MRENSFGSLFCAAPAFFVCALNLLVIKWDSALWWVAYSWLYVVLFIWTILLTPEKGTSVVHTCGTSGQFSYCSRRRHSNTLISWNDLHEAAQWKLFCVCVIVCEKGCCNAVWSEKSSFQHLRQRIQIFTLHEQTRGYMNSYNPVMTV